MEQPIKAAAASPGHRPNALASFTLIELLVVMAIIAIIGALSVNTFVKVVDGYHLTSSGDIVMSQLDLARQTAIGKNCQVEFRIYQVPDPTGTAGAMSYRAFQSFSLDDGGTQTNAITRPQFLPGLVDVAPSIAVSSLLNTSASPPYAVSGTQSGQLFSGYSPSSYNYVDFHFNPDGSTDLNATASWFMSIVLQHDALQANGLPHNFITILIDPLSGRARNVRPN